MKKSIITLAAVAAIITAMAAGDVMAAGRGNGGAGVTIQLFS